MNVIHNHSELPFVIFPELNLKALIDTGSTRSFINPDIAQKYFKEKIKNDPFKITTAHGTSLENFSIIIPASKLFNYPNTLLKYHLFNFHKNFDILLGLDNLKILNANIDLTHDKITTPTQEIKIHYHRILPKFNHIKIPPKSEKFTKIIANNIENGEAFIPETKINNLIIPEGLAKIENNEIIYPIINLGENDEIINCVDCVQVQEINNFEINNISFIQNETKFKLDMNNIRTDHMNSEEKREIRKLLSEYSDIFHKDDKPLTFTNEIKHSIRTKDEIPVYAKTYRYPEVHRKEVESQIKKMLNQNIIRPSHSPWSSPVWIVPKKLDASGKRKWRLVIDYRKLNEKTIDDKYPIPNINTLLDKLGRCQYFSTLDLASGFHQIEMSESDIQKTAFSTENGHFEYLRMPFGLKNAPATFQRVMDNVLRNLTNEICLVYLDDVIIFSTSLQEHIQNLKSVFNRLRKANLKIQPDKCEFLRTEVSYLGHVVTPDGVKPNPDKIHAIKNYPIPKTATEIKAFLGLLGYYRKFIKDFADLTKPFTKCLKKDATIKYNDPEYINCFNTCKNVLINEPILQYPDYKKPFNLTTDASQYAIGAILSQGPIGSDLPIAYASRTLNSSEINYSTIEKELLAVVWATQKFRHYLYGRKFKIITDHKPLIYLHSLKQPHSKLMRWRLKLEEYDYEVIHKKGSLNKNADALSRIELNINTLDPESQSLFDLIENFNDTYSNPDNDKQSLIVEPDEDEQHDPETDQTIHSNPEHPIVGITITESPVNFGKNQIFISQVKHSPSKPKIQKFHCDKMRIHLQISETDFEQDTVNFIKEYITPKVKYYLYFETPIYEKFSNVLQKYFKHSEIKFVKSNIKLIDVEENDEILQVIKNFHEGKTNHRGINEVHTQIKKRYYWPNQLKTITDFINQCEICLAAKYERNPIKPKLNITPTPNKPLDIIHIDTLSLENTKFLTIIDAFSKYAQAYKVTSTNAIEIANKLTRFFSHHGIPKLIVADNGLEFKNNVIKELLSLHKIEIHFICSQNPNSNGLVERFHSTLIEHIRLFNLQENFKNELIKDKVNYAILAYNNTNHSTTNLKPVEIINGHLDTNSPLDIELEKQIMQDYIQKHKEKTKLVYKNINNKLQTDKTKTITKLNENREELPDIPEIVYVHNKQKVNKTKNPKFKKEKIKKVNKNLKTAEIDTENNDKKQSKIHLSNLKGPRKLINKYPAIPGPSTSRIHLE